EEMFPAAGVEAGIVESGEQLRSDSRSKDDDKTKALHFCCRESFFFGEVSWNKNGEEETKCGHHAVAEDCDATGVNEYWEHYRPSRIRDSQAFLLTQQHLCSGQQKS